MNYTDITTNPVILDLKEKKSKKYLQPYEVQSR